MLAALPTVNLPDHCRPQSSKPWGRYLRRKRSQAPCCQHCGKRYRAASTRAVVTWYYPRCQCAPRGGIARTRPERGDA
jgi:hypothetical protein